MNHRSLCLAFTGWLALAAASARAVVVAGDTGTADEAAPVVMNASGSNIGGNVGTFNDNSCIYIGNGWVLTADHVGAGNPVFPGVNGNQAFTYDGNSGRQLTMPDGTGKADLYLFHLTSDPALPDMTLSSTSAAALAANKTAVTMYGHGSSLTSGLNYYDISTNPYSISGMPTNERGYSVGGTHVFRSGTNFVDGSQLAVNDGFGRTDSLITTFNPGNNPNANAQASFGDSGGAVFGKTADGSYELVGMMYAIGSNIDTTNQPSSNSAVYSLTSFEGDTMGDGTSDSVTAAADISAYLSQIESITGVPEPATRWVGVLVGAALLGSCRRRIGARRS